MLGVKTGVWVLKNRAGGQKMAGAQKMLLGAQNMQKSVAGWSKRVVEGSWMVEMCAGGLKDEVGGLKTHCWWSRHVAGVDNTWLGVKNVW